MGRRTLWPIVLLPRILGWRAEKTFLIEFLRISGYKYSLNALPIWGKSTRQYLHYHITILVRNDSTK